tara:strand:- start:15 stop:515 length:501 start_codon:yes stop_codon:yes gene_type:complete
MKKFSVLLILLTFLYSSNALSDQPKSIGKYKSWEAFTYNGIKGKVCFAQTIPLDRAPKNLKRDPSRLFVTFRKNEKIKNELSVTSGHMYKKSSVIAKSGKNEFLFFSQGNFAWLIDGEEEFNLIKTMKRASKLSVTARTSTGTETKDMYSMMGFTKAYNTARKSCA